MHRVKCTRQKRSIIWNKKVERPKWKLANSIIIMTNFWTFRKNNKINKSTDEKIKAEKVMQWEPFINYFFSRNGCTWKAIFLQYYRFREIMIWTVIKVPSFSCLTLPICKICQSKSSRQKRKLGTVEPVLRLNKVINLWK